MRFDETVAGGSAEREFRRGVAPVSPAGGWDETAVIRRVAASDDVDAAYDRGWEDGRRLWRRTAWCSMAFTAVTFGALVVALLLRVPS